MNSRSRERQMHPEDPGSAPPDHGGDLGAVARRFGRPASEWLDLSTGINPRSYPVDPIPSGAWSDLPQADDMAAVETAAAAAYGAEGPECVVAAPGTQALIQLLPRVLRLPPSPGEPRVAVAAPTYAEHEACWRAAGVTVAPVADLPPPDRSLVVVNPNNPDGRVFPPDRLADWARQAAAGGHWLIVDEAFADVRPDISLIPLRPGPNVLVLRSFGKFFGLAGLRLGFAVAAPKTVQAIAQRLGPWAVSGPALAIGRRALADGVWITATRRRLGTDRQRLADQLTAAGLRVVGGTDLFVLVQSPSAEAVWTALARQGVLTRRFSDRPDLLRFGLPDGSDQWDRLGDGLGAWRDARPAQGA